MKKRTKRFDEGGITEGANPNIDEDTRARAMASVAGGEDVDAQSRGEEILKGIRDKAAAPAAKPRVVSKEELAKSGMTLRDFLNKERGLTRRGGPAPTPAAPVPTARPTTPPVADAKTAAKYETPYDRMNRKNAEESSAKAETAAETERLRKRSPAPGRGVFKTSEQKFMGSGYSKGGSVSKASSRGDGIAQRGKTKGRMI